VSSRVVDEDIDLIVGQRAWPQLEGRSFLVTGATGMIGQYLVRALLRLGRGAAPTRVVAVTRREGEAARAFAPERHGGGLEIIGHDPEAEMRAPAPLDYVIHAGSPATPTAFRDDPVGVIAANVAGSDRLLRVARDHGAVFCLLSSAEVYGRAPAGAPGSVTEAAAGVLDSLDPRSAYPESKRLAEAMCVAYQRQHGVDYRIARLAHTYGPGMALRDPRVQAYFMRQALLGEDIRLESDGSARRTYTYVADAVSGLLHLLAAPASLVCNIADEDAAVTIAELARAVLRCCPGTRAQLRFSDSAASGAAETMAPPLLDCSRLRALGWTARVGLEAGLSRTLAHHRQVLPAG
jgi:dTDP-glucose 4,6-dehydratase